MTNISWTEESWNPTTGCSRISEGCRNCYAEALSLRHKWSPAEWTAQNAGRNIVLHPDRLDIPRRRKKSTKYFVNSMSDLFHELVPDSFIAEVFTVMADLRHRHTFQILTKRAERMAAWPGPWTLNIWAGVSVENRRSLYRLDYLRQSQAEHLWVSFEPLLEDLGLIDLDYINWVVAGGESGPHRRPFDHAWARLIRDQCKEQRIPFYFKQGSDFKPQARPYLTEADGSETEWKQCPTSFQREKWREKPYTRSKPIFVFNPETEFSREDFVARNQPYILGDILYLTQHADEMLLLCNQDPYFAQSRREQIEHLIEIIPEYHLLQYMDEMRRLLAEVIKYGDFPDRIPPLPESKVPQ